MYPATTAWRPEQTKLSKPGRVIPNHSSSYRSRAARPPSAVELPTRRPKRDVLPSQYSPRSSPQTHGMLRQTTEDVHGHLGVLERDLLGLLEHPKTLDRSRRRGRETLLLERVDALCRVELLEHGRIGHVDSGRDVGGLGVSWRRSDPAIPE
jgi:hypothetical protein